MFLGGNYSATLKTEGAPVHAGGVNYSVLFDWGRFRGLYLGAGVALVLSACHRLGALYLRYGAEVEACAVSAMNYSYKTRYTLPDGDVAVFRDFMASPFVSHGWRLLLHI